MLKLSLNQLNFLDETNWNELGIFDIIVSNPPYIKQSEIINMQPNVVANEPHIALFVADDDALDFLQKNCCIWQNTFNCPWKNICRN
ncbi:MAG: hypothetical protein V9E96_13280 [Chitinophagaceae bacterium]